MDLKKNWDRRTGLGRQKLFEVRKLYNDITFLDEFFTLEFCIDQKFYTFGFQERSGNWEIMSREFKKVKDQLLKMLPNRGQPVIVVEDGNFENRSELQLRAGGGVRLTCGYGRGGSRIQGASASATRIVTSSIPRPACSRSRTAWAVTRAARPRREWRSSCSRRSSRKRATASTPRSTSSARARSATPRRWPRSPIPAISRRRSPCGARTCSRRAAPRCCSLRRSRCCAVWSGARAARSSCLS